MSTRNSRRRSSATRRKSKAKKDPIDGLKNPQIKRLAYRAGAQRIDGGIYDMVRKLIHERSDKLVGKTLVFTTHAKRKTVSVEDLHGALQSEGLYLMAGGDTAKELKGCKAKPKKTTKAGATKPHRFRPGTVAKRQITYNQKNSDCLVFEQKPFKEFVRHLADHKLSEWRMRNKKLRFKEDFFKLFQLVIEEYLVGLLRGAVRIAEHSQKQSVRPKDIALADALDVHTMRTV